MSFKVSDPVFSPKAEPGTVLGREEGSGRLKVDQDKKQVQNDHRHGYLKGLSTQDRKSINEIMDEVRETDDVRERLDLLVGKIQEVKGDPAKFRLLSYLNAEQAHLIASYNIRPRTYQIDPNQMK